MLSILALLLGAPAVQAEIDLRAMMATHVLCGKPNSAKKSCESIDSFQGRPDGTILSISEGVANDGSVLKYSGPVIFDRDLLCIDLTLDLAKNMIISAGSTELRAGDVAQDDVASLNKLFGGNLGKRLCNRLRAKGDALAVEVLLDGKILDTIVGRWIRKSDGFRLKSNK